jgi:hypothetical protein
MENKVKKILKQRNIKKTNIIKADCLTGVLFVDRTMREDGILKRN